ncbi:MAG: hypothetical protein FJ265_17070 [Planctomycetes bacterium]|nr:hypothetical protein [Planctomycetota bacterium]
MTDPLDLRLDESLRAAFAPPPASTFTAAAARAVGRPRALPRWPWFVAAAALLVVAVLMAAWPRPRGPEGHDGRELGALWAAAYHDAEAQGFGVEGCPRTGADLCNACEKRFSCRLAVAKGSDLALLGTYEGRPTGGSMTLLARAGGEPLCVCVLPQRQDPRVKLPRDSGLHLARRELGDLVLYAVAKSPARGALDSFVVP